MASDHHGCLRLSSIHCSAGKKNDANLKPSEWHEFSLQDLNQVDCIDTPPHAHTNLPQQSTEYCSFLRRLCLSTNTVFSDPLDSSFRRYLHELLKEVYPYYDIVIWSATSMRWIEIKLRELGISNTPEYKISMLMDGTCMVAVNSSRKGTPNSASSRARLPTS